MKYAVVTFGCRVNQADSFDVEGALLGRGATVSSPEEADVVIVNTCSVTSSADQAARQTVRRITRQNPGARVIVTGCYATRRPEEWHETPAVFVVPNSQKSALGAAIAAEAGLPDVTTADRFGGGAGSCGAALEPGVAGRTAITLRAQTGCDESCSYCIIPSTRGTSRSVALEDMSRLVRQAVDAGFKEIVLTGVHLGSYGRDLTPPRSLADLLRALIHEGETRRASAGGRIVGAPVRFRISSLEPMDCTPEVVDLLSVHGTIADHFHLPLQHASDRMLHAMQRPYTLDRYRAVVDGIRQRNAHAAIGSDVIVGFPGECDSDFDLLAGYLAASPLTHLHVFPYSDRPGTAAARLPGKVPGSVIRERARLLREISVTLAREFRERQVGRVVRALTLDDGTTAVTGNYLKASIPPGRVRNEWVDVRIEQVDRGLVIGTPV